MRMNSITMVGQDEERGVRGRKRARQSVFCSRFRASASTNSNGMTGTGAGPETGRLSSWLDGQRAMSGGCHILALDGPRRGVDKP